MGVANLDSQNVTVKNTGKISLTDNGAGQDYGVKNYQIAGSSQNFTLINSGTIFVYDNVGNGNDIGIYNTGANNLLIINSGLISCNDYAMYLTGGTTPNLSLLLGSNIQGPVHVDTAPLNLAVQTGLNLALTLDATSTAFGNLNIKAPYVVHNDPVIAVIDPTGLAIQPDMTADFSDTLLSGVNLHYSCASPCTRGSWGEVLGSYRTRAAQSQTLPYTDWLGGFLIGYDIPAASKPLSIFAGYSYAQAQIQQAPQQANISLGCAGLAYASCLCHMLMEVSAIGGYVNWDNTRIVMNNLSPGGMDNANVDIQGALFTTEAKIARSIPCLFCRPFCSFALRYAGLFLGTYTEHGSLADLTIKNRTVGLLTTRLDAAFCPKKYFGCVKPYVGVYGRYQVQGTSIQGILLGDDIYFDQEGPLNLVAGFLGIRGAQPSGCFRKFFNFEVGFDNANSTRVLGEVGMSF